MQVSTGRVVTMDEYDHIKESYGFDPHDWIEVIGTTEQVQNVSQRVRLGSQEIERRRKRKEMQKNSRNEAKAVFILACRTASASTAPMPSQRGSPPPR